ncbi:Uncharacterised protein [Mycobacteroides abscessus subsp. abscessus]|nr:Uncharacterised protein [Mycobacteroides abscessus subsp. abscessus]
MLTTVSTASSTASQSLAMAAPIWSHSSSPSRPTNALTPLGSAPSTGWELKNLVTVSSSQTSPMLRTISRVSSSSAMVSGSGSPAASSGTPTRS